jgi:hypothetical protein
VNTKRAAPARLKPWHLFTEEERDIATRMMVICSSENPRAGNVPPPEPWMQEINDAMLALLRAAAPYPDEALAFEVIGHDDGMPGWRYPGWHGEYVGEFAGWPKLRFADGCEQAYHPDHILPLTIAAQDLLTGGVR